MREKYWFSHSHSVNINSNATGGHSHGVNINTNGAGSHSHGVGALNTGNQSANHTHSVGAVNTGANNRGHTHTTNIGSHSHGLTPAKGHNNIVVHSNTGTGNAAQYVVPGTGDWLTSSFVTTSTNIGNKTSGGESQNHTHQVLAHNTGGQSVNHTHSIGAHNTGRVGNHTYNVNGNTGNTGSGTALNVQNPYITVYMWKRTA